MKCTVTVRLRDRQRRWRARRRRGAISRASGRPPPAPRLRDRRRAGQLEDTPECVTARARGFEFSLRHHDDSRRVRAAAAMPGSPPSPMRSRSCRAPAARPARSSAAAMLPRPRGPTPRPGNPRRRRSWLSPDPLRHRHGRTPASHAADRIGARQRMRTSSPCAAWRAISSASVSSVTALTTRRPPGRSAATTHQSPGRPAPPPTKIASGCANPAALRRGALNDLKPGTPNAAALRRMRAT